MVVLFNVAGIEPGFGNQYHRSCKLAFARWCKRRSDRSEQTQGADDNNMAAAEADTPGQRVQASLMRRILQLEEMTHVAEMSEEELRGEQTETLGQRLTTNTKKTSKRFPTEASGGSDTDDSRQFVERMKNGNTKRKTIGDVRLFKEYIHGLYCAFNSSMTMSMYWPTAWHRTRRLSLSVRVPHYGPQGLEILECP